MATMKTHISWTDSTWNPSTGCTKVSAGCDFCYAEALTNRLWGGNFENVTIHPDRIATAARFTPLRDARGRLTPRRVFVNSMSDLMHSQIGDDFRHLCFDAMEAMPFTAWQVLTKRPMTLRRFVEARYKGRGVPRNIWLGASVEDNRVAGRIDILRAMKEALGDFTAFLSVEPLIGPCERHDYRGIDQVLIGGESGPNARPMPADLARTSRDIAQRAGAAIWFKQFGQWRNNPLYLQSNAPTHFARVAHAIRAGEREARIVTDPNTGRQKIEGEKGGATLDGKVWHDMPAAFKAMAADLNRKPRNLL